MDIGENRALIALAFLAIAAAGYAAGRGAVPGHGTDTAHLESVAEHDYRAGRPSQAFPLFKKLAGAGDTTAAFYLGEMYQLGDGTAPDGDMAIKWLTVAADAGNAPAARQLGLLYLHGMLHVQDLALARKWLQTAADSGDDAALRNLGDMEHNGLGTVTDPVEAYAYYAAAAARGNGYGEIMRDRIARTLTASQQAQGERRAADLAASFTKPAKQRN